MTSACYDQGVVVAAASWIESRARGNQYIDHGALTSWYVLYSCVDIMLSYLSRFVHSR